MNNTRLLFWNAQGINNKRQELLQLVQSRKINIILYEIHLISNKKFKLPNLITYATNKPLINGRPPAKGTAILIHRRFIYQTEIIHTSFINNTFITITLGNIKTRIVLVYKSPKTIL